ncbi:MAG TPA: preprotein translocase subunit SecG [Acidimicrobiales bacterium]|nr:preprotein translocase subunit SecG [Acidimicrobiales bacterium]
MLTDLIVVVQIIVALILILLILLHAGRGGGVSDMFGGAASGVASGSSVAERNLDRWTILVALVFAFSTVAMAIRWQ